MRRTAILAGFFLGAFLTVNSANAEGRAEYKDPKNFNRLSLFSFGANLTHPGGVGGELPGYEFIGRSGFSVRVVPLFFHQARTGEPLTVFGKEKCLDFTYIDDTVDAILLAVQQFDHAKNDTYNIATGTGTTLSHLAARIKELTGSSSQIRTGEVRTGEIVKFVADISKAKEKLGYQPKVMFEEGIKRTVEWYKKNS